MTILPKEQDSMLSLHHLLPNMNINDYTEYLTKNKPNLKGITSTFDPQPFNSNSMQSTNMMQGNKLMLNVESMEHIHSSSKYLSPSTS